MDIGDVHSLSTQRVFGVLRGFVREFSNRAEVSHLVTVVESEQIQNTDKELDSVSLNQQPEKFVEESLVEPILTKLRHDLRSRPKNYPKWTESTPDFAVTNFDVGVADGKQGMRSGCSVIVEVKPFNNIEQAEIEAKEYLSEDAGKDALAIGTDGLRWRAWFQPRTENTVTEDLLDIDLRKPTIELARVHKEGEVPDSNRIRDMIESEDVMTLNRVRLEKKVQEILDES